MTICKKSIQPEVLGAKLTTGFARVSRLCTVLLVSCLAACSWVKTPGYGGMQLPPGSTAIDLEYDVIGAHSPITVRRITQALNREMNAQRKATESQQLVLVQGLLGQSKPTEYKIDANDVIYVDVKAGQDQTSAISDLAAASGRAVQEQLNFTLGKQGEITLPLVGKVMLKGLTEREAELDLEARYELYYKQPTATVRVQGHRAKRVYLNGEFKAPGSQNLTNTHYSFADVFAKAGGFANSLDRFELVLSRKGASHALNVTQLQQSGVDLNALALQDGDVLTANRLGNRVGVTGEIGTKFIQIRDTGLSLNEVLIEAGGVNVATADTRQIYVIRQKEAGNPEVFHLNSQSPISLAIADNFQMQSRDVVYVDSVPLVRWNRLINVVLPAAQTIIVTQSLTK